MVSSAVLLMMYNMLASSYISLAFWLLLLVLCVCEINFSSRSSLLSLTSCFLCWVCFLL